MIESIRQLFNDLDSGNLKKGNVTQTLDYTLDNIRNNIIPILDSMTANKILTILKANPRLSKFGKDCEFKGSNPYSILEELKKFFNRVLNESGKLQDSINRYLSATMSSKAVTARDGAILRIVSDLSSISLYTLDFLHLSLVGNGKNNFPKAHIQSVDSGYVPYCSLIRHYNKELEKNIAGLKEVSLENINFTGDDSVLDTFFKNTGKSINLPVTGFVGNPLYHFRMWIADREHQKYEKNKEEKRLLELRLLALQAEKDKDGVDLNKLNKQIEYYEDTISNIEFKISQYEKSIG